MIKAKNKECIICGRTDQPWFSKKRCKSCTISSTPNTLTQRKPIKKQTQKNIAYRNMRSAIRDVYFSYHIERCKISEESGVSINSPNRANIAHIIDKGRHKSVQSHLDNFVYLTIQQHTEFDKLLFENNFKELEKKFPNAWSIALERLKTVLPECVEKTKFIVKLEEYLSNR